ncbi:MAG TPA: helix-turn-helix transcriptional regulator [Terriglobales bacterium]|nr:helix-turn-helix transcriptional regulator [Terriglobales bacterium]
MKKKGRAAYMISAVAEQYGVHPQTLRLYEREGLLKPSRTEGNTRLYTDEDLQRLEVILSLTRDMGVNLAGVEVVLGLREKMQHMQKQMQEFVDFVQHDWANRAVSFDNAREALVRVRPAAPPDAPRRRR